MLALFIAHGGEFKKHLVARPFPNIELYNVMADLLNITAQPNNGTQGSLHYILENPKIINEKPIVNIPALCTENNINFDEWKNVTGCLCDKQYEPLKNDENKLHTPWDLVSTSIKDTSVCVIYNEDYTLAFDFHLRLPVWTSFTIDKVSYRKIISCWSPDSRIPLKYTSNCKDYVNLPIDLKQHPLFPPEFSSSVTPWFVTNSVPMFPHFHDINEFLLDIIHHWSFKYGVLNVITGPAFDIKNNGIRYPINDILNAQKYNVLVPTHYFTIVTRCIGENSIELCMPQNLDVLAFILPHLPEMENCQDKRDYILKHSARVKDVEILTGLRFFTSLPIYEQIRLQTYLASQLWES